MKVLYIIILGTYILSLSFILLYSLVQAHLVILYRRSKRKNERLKAAYQSGQVDLPFVTIQLPLFNEKYVVERLLECAASIDYPRDKFEIQVLDDSTDESFDIGAEKCAELAANGIQIEHIKRPVREGFKAGALQYGLKLAKGELIAIFDADFLPEADFLIRTIPYFEDSEVGMVQCRWGHINEDYSILTKALAFQLNAHFSVEQRGRNSQDFFMNFNGTAGVWRKAAILDAGGWEADTLTEDLDLSYRTQLKGWKFKFLEDVVAPAELPAVMSAIKSQQFRWTKGGAETARKHVWNILKSGEPLKKKLHGVAHLLNATIFIFVLITAILSVPVLVIKNLHPEFNSIFMIGSVFMLAFLILIFFYTNSLSIRKQSIRENFLYFIRMFPTFLCLSMGLSLHNSIAVLEGLLGKKSAFIRTPKFNIKKVSDQWQHNKYLRVEIDKVTIMEALLTLYFIAGIVYAIVAEEYALLPFHLMLVLGFGTITFFSFYHTRLDRS